MKYFYYGYLSLSLALGSLLAVFSYGWWFIVKGKSRADDVKKDFKNFVDYLKMEWSLIEKI
jgi:hypothetical protein